MQAILKAANPDQMTADERLGEVAEILAASLSRLLGKQSSHLPDDRRESSLDCLAHQSGDPNVLNGGLE